MQIQVKDILELDGFKGARLVAGEEGMDKIVTNATVMEVPDIYRYVEEHNLLITTLYPIAHDKESMEKLIPRLAELKLSGICIKPERYIDEINETMINQANKLNFPIISLPKGSNLSDLVAEISEISLQSHIDMLSFRDCVHRQLMDLFLRGADIDYMVSALASIVELPVILLDTSFNITSKSNDLKNKDLSIILEENNYGSPSLKIKIDRKEYGEDSYSRHNINAGKTRFGYLILLSGRGDSESLRIAMEQASLLLASTFYKNNAVLEKEKSFMDAFIRDLLQGKVYSTMDAIGRAKRFGWNLEFPMVIMMARLLPDDKDRRLELYGKILDSKLIEKTIQERLNISKNKIKTVYIDDSVVIFINTILMDQVEINCVKAGCSILQEMKDKAKVGIGISNIINSIDGIPLAYKEAKRSVKAGSILYQDSFVNHYNDYRVFDIISEVRDINVLNKFVEDKLGKVIDHDNNNDFQLMNTLKVLIECNFNIKKASQELFIHYNTLRYRIDRLKELGIEIDNGFEIGELVLAYNIYIWLIASEIQDTKGI